jgi:hypothetical protein
MIQMMMVVLVLAGLGWWWSGPSSDELVVYSARCLDGTPILPPTLVIRTETFEQDFQKYQKDRENCVIVPGSRTVYKLNNARAEVYYIGLLSEPRRLVDCAIFSRTDWACSYPDGSGRVVVIDGLEAIHADDVKPEPRTSFYQRRWQWWVARLWSLVGRPQGAWLIPEQRVYV